MTGTPAGHAKLEETSPESTHPCPVWSMKQYWVSLVPFPGAGFRYGFECIAAEPFRWRSTRNGFAFYYSFGGGSRKGVEKVKASSINNCGPDSKIYIGAILK